MTTGGWIVMIVSVTSVTVFFASMLFLSLRKDD